VYVCVKVFDDSKMINQMMSQPVVSTDTIDDDDELQQELDDLLAAKVDLPSAPLRPTTERFGNHRLLLIACGYCCFFIFWECDLPVCGASLHVLYRMIFHYFAI